MRKVTKRWKQSLLILKKSCPPPANQQNNVRDRTCTIKLPRGFDSECKKAQTRCRQLKKRSKSLQTEDSQEEFRLARHHKGRIIRKAKRKEFRLSREEMCKSPDTMWKACRYARNTAPRQACLPPLNRNLDPLSVPDLVNSPQTKAKLL